MRKIVASPDDCPTATKDSSIDDQSKARNEGTLVCVDNTSCSRFLPSNPVTLQWRNDFPDTSTRRKRCSSVVDDGAQRIAVSMLLVVVVATAVAAA